MVKRKHLNPNGADPKPSRYVEEEVTDELPLPRNSGLKTVILMIVSAICFSLVLVVSTDSYVSATSGEHVRVPMLRDLLSVLMEIVKVLFGG